MDIAKDEDVMEDLTISVEIPSDDEGFLDRQCHGENCGRYFKVLDGDWEASSTNAVTCPFCGFADEPDNFTTDEQQEYLEEVAAAYVEEQLQQILKGFAKSVNRSQARNRLFSLSVETKFTEIPVPISPAAVESMRLQIICDSCGCTYAVIGSGFFCPLCGRNSARQTFRQSLLKARNAVEVARELGSRNENRDAAAEAKRDALENQINNLVTAFQRFGEALYPELPKYNNPPSRNLFQRLAQASTQWNQAGGRLLEVVLSPTEWGELLKFFQQRHVLSHQDGFVDSEYIAKSGDATYREGQRLVITEAQVLRMTELVEKLADGMLTDVPTASVRPPMPQVVPSSLFPQKLPGTTDEDWRVFQVVCEMVVESDHNFLGGQDVWDRCKDKLTSEAEFGESLEILKSKSLVSLSYVMGSRSIPSTIRVSRKGLDIYFSHVTPNYAEVRRQVAQQLLDGQSLSSAIAEATGSSQLFTHHTLNDFESRGWVPKLFWNGGIAIVTPSLNVHLKRFVEN